MRNNPRLGSMATLALPPWEPQCHCKEELRNAHHPCLLRDPQKEGGGWGGGLETKLSDLFFWGGYLRADTKK